MARPKQDREPADEYRNRWPAPVDDDEPERETRHDDEPGSLFDPID